jgi:DNA modification methylase
VGARAVLPRFITSLNYPKGTKMLDFGCGRDFIHAAQLREAGFRVYGYDLSFAGERHLPRGGLHWRGVLAHAGSFDVVFASNVLNVQRSKRELADTCREIEQACGWDLGYECKLYLNYPNSPRKLGWSMGEMLTFLEWFWERRQVLYDNGVVAIGEPNE